MMRRRWPWVAVALLVIVGAVVVSVPQALDRRDPRAFAVDDGEIGFDEVQERTGLTMPDCLGSDFQYAFVRESSTFSYRKIYLEFVTEEECFERFLANGSGSYRRATDEWSWRSPWSQLEVVRDLGWRVDAARPMEEFGFTTETWFDLRGVAQPDPATGTLHVYVSGWRLP